MLDPDGAQQGHPAGCVIAHEYSSATFVSLCFHSRKQECRDFSETWEPPQLHGRQVDDMKEVPYRRPAKIRLHRTKLSRPGARDLCNPVRKEKLGTRFENII
jgi:hypothetical protein